MELNAKSKERVDHTVNKPTFLIKHARDRKVVNTPTE